MEFLQGDNHQVSLLLTAIKESFLSQSSLVQFMPSNTEQGVTQLGTCGERGEYST